MQALEAEQRQIDHRASIVEKKLRRLMESGKHAVLVSCHVIWDRVIILDKKCASSKSHSNITDIFLVIKHNL